MLFIKFIRFSRIKGVCGASFTEEGDEIESWNFNAGFNGWVSAPTQSLLQKWIREIHNIHIEIFLESDPPYRSLYFRVMTLGEYFVTSHDGSSRISHEETLEEALQEALKLIP